MSEIGKKNRVPAKKRVNKATFIAKLQKRYSEELGINASEQALTDMFNVMMDEVKGQLISGKGIFLKGFGNFYPKKMKARKVVTNFEIANGGEPQTYKVPARTKLGFSSNLTADEQITYKDKYRLGYNYNY